MPENVFSALKSIDAGLFEWVNQNLHNTLLDAAMPLVTMSGEGGLIWIFLALLLLVTSRGDAKRVPLLMIFALTVSFLVGEEALKHIFQRPRPFDTLTGVELLVLPPLSFSFPSGHAANAFASCFVLARKVPTLALPALTMAFVMAFSRVYVGVHYPSDVIAGALLGLACAQLVIKYESTIFSAINKVREPFVP